MISTNSSDTSFNNQLIKSKCPQLRHRKRSNKSICSQTASMSTCLQKTINKRRYDLKTRCSDSRQTSIVRTNNFVKVKNSAKNIDNWTCRLPKQLSHYFKSINSWTNSRPMCYLIELIGRCRRPWIKSAKATGGKKYVVHTFHSISIYIMYTPID
jgi:hypothetical protein